LDSSTTANVTGIDTHISRQASLQPIWYTEQTIVDDNHERSMLPEETRRRTSISSFDQQRSDYVHSSLPTIASDSPYVDDEESLPNKNSLMRKSSTFIIEHQTSMTIRSPLNESEKENDCNVIIASTQYVLLPIDSIVHLSA
jgi:hypothetical protein